MAGNIKGITIEFRGDTTKLDKALRDIRNSTKDLDRELKSVDKALKFNPTSVELWKQKQEILRQKISQTEDNLKELKNIQAQMDAKNVDKQSEAYRTIQREIIEAESKLKTFNTQLRKIGQVNLRAMSEQFKKMGTDLQSAGQAMRGISTAAAALAASLGALTVKSGKWADDLNTMSKRYSIGTKDLQMYAAAAELVDTDVETIAKSHVKLEKSMLTASKGTGTAAQAFEALGVQVTNADGSLRNGEQVWQETIKALGQMENETERDAYAMALMGRSASELNPLIEDGGETYQKLAETMQKYGLEFIDQETLDQANEFNDALDTIKAVGLVAFQQLGTQLAAYLAPAMEKVVDVVGRLANWFSNLSPRTQAIIAAIAGVVAVVSPLLIGLGKLSMGIGAIIKLVAIVGPAIGGIVAALGPVILIIAAVVAAGVLLYKNWDTIKAKAIDLKNKVVAAFNEFKTKVASIWSAITAPITKAVSTIQNAISKIKSIVNGAKLSLPKFKLPHFNISSGKLPWGIGGKGTPPKISVSWYAEGGIFDSASLIGVGEKGPEAVVPLDTLWQKLDNIAAASAGGATVINVYGSPGMDVNELAAAVERKLAALQKQRNMAYGGI